MATLDPEYCKEKARHNQYLIDVRIGFKKVLDNARVKHSKMKEVPRIQVFKVLTKLLDL